MDAGFTNAIGTLDIDSTWGGTITVNSALSVTGNFTLASGSFGGNGAVTIAGTASQWTGGQIDVGSGGFTNTGTLSADTTGRQPGSDRGRHPESTSGTITETGADNLAPRERRHAQQRQAGRPSTSPTTASVAQAGSGGTLTICRHAGEDRQAPARQPSSRP